MALRKELTKLNFADSTLATLLGFRSDTGVCDNISIGSGLQLVGNVLSATGGGGGGAVTSVNASTSISGLSFSGGPINAGNPSGTLSLTGIVGVTGGGTGVNILAIGDILVANSTTTFGKLSTPAGQNVLLCNGVGSVAYGKVDLGIHVTSILPATNGGTGFNLLTVGSMLYASSTTAWSQIPPPGAGQFFLSSFNNTIQWGTVTTGGTVTQVTAGNLSPIFTTNVTNQTTTPSISFSLSAQVPNTFFVGPLSGGSAAPTFRLMGFNDLPYEAEDPVVGTTLLLAQADNRRMKRCTNISGCVVTLPTSGITTGSGFFIYRALGAGVVSFTTSGTFEGASTSLAAEATGVYLVYRGSGLWVAFGALSSGGGLTNIAANTELAQSDGTNLVDSGVFIPTKGSLTLGSATLSGNRSITMSSLDATSNLTIKTKGATNSLIIDKQGGAVSSLTANAYIVLGSISDASGSRTITTNGAGSAEQIVIAPRAGTTLLTNPTGGDVQVQIGGLGSGYYLTSTSNGHILNGGQNGNTSTLSFKINGNFGNSTSNSGSGIIVSAGDAYQLAGNGNGGDLTLKSGVALGSGSVGNISIDANTGVTSLKGDSVRLTPGTGSAVGAPFLVIGQRTSTFPLSAGSSVIIYGQDSSDNTVALSLYTEQVVEALGTFTPTQKYKIQINGLFYWIQLDPVV